MGSCQGNGLYQIMLSMKYLRPTKDSWTVFITDFKQLLNKYSDVCDIRRLNFPSDWTFRRNDSFRLSTFIQSFL